MDPKEQQRQNEAMWRMSAMGTELAFGIIGMVLLGIGIDYLLGSSPVALVVCTICGILGSGYNFLRRAVALNKQSQEAFERGHKRSKPAGDPGGERDGGANRPGGGDDKLRLPDDFNDY